MPLLAFSLSLSLSLHFITGGCRVLNRILKNYARLHHERTVQRRNRELCLGIYNRNISEVFLRTSLARGGHGVPDHGPRASTPPGCGVPLIVIFRMCQHAVHAHRYRSLSTSSL